MHNTIIFAFINYSSVSKKSCRMLLWCSKSSHIFYLRKIHLICSCVSLTIGLRSMSSDFIQDLLLLCYLRLYHCWPNEATSEFNSLRITYFVCVCDVDIQLHEIDKMKCSTHQKKSIMLLLSFICVVFLLYVLNCRSMVSYNFLNYRISGE